MRGATWRGVVRGVVVLAGASVAAVGVYRAPVDAEAQVRYGVYWLTQPHQPARVGRVWCNAVRTVEYWAYVDGEYRWADIGNQAANPWQLCAVRGEDASYASFAEFQAATCALPEFQGKALIFQNHSVLETVVQN